MLTKEYRIAMPLTVQEYQIGQVSGSNKVVSFTIIKFFKHVSHACCCFQNFQLYMIARHSLEQSQGGEGVEVVENRECSEDEEK